MMKKWRALKPLVMMQLKDKMDLGFLRNRKQLVLKLGLFMVLFLAYCFLIQLAFSLGIQYKMLTLTGRLPETFIIFLFTLMLLLSIINCTFGLTKSLYLAPDNQILLVQPVKPNVVFISKIIVFYIRELQRNIFFVVPMFWAFGMINGLSLAFYPLVLFLYFFVSLLSVLIGALLSIPALWLAIMLRNFKSIQVAIYAVLASALAYVAFLVIDAIPPNFNVVESFAILYWQVQDFLKAFADFFWICADLTHMIVGQSSFFFHSVLPMSSMITFLWMLVFLIVASVLIYFISEPLFVKMASRPFEYRKKSLVLRKQNRRHSSVCSMIWKEVRTSVRTPELVVKDFGIIFILPLTIFLLNKIYSSMDMRVVGTYMAMSFTLLLTLLVVLCFNTSIASSISRDGAAFYHIKTSPARTRAKLYSKLFVKVVSSLIAIFITCGILFTTGILSFASSYSLFLFTTFVMLAHALWSLEMDLMNPRWQHYLSERTTESNPNENRSHGVAYAVSFLAFGISYGLFMESLGGAWIKLLLIAAAFLVFRVLQFIWKSQVYFKEKL